MDKRETQILATVDRLKDEILDFTAKLVAQPSTLGAEQGAMQVMEARLAELGWNPTRVPLSGTPLTTHPGYAPVPWDHSQKFNVVSVRPADAPGGKSALFNGHLDVVSAEPLEQWARDPFTPREADGWMYGRGAGDMKSGVAAMTYALAAVEQAGFGLTAPVTIEAVVEEECSGNGALACMAAGYDADAVLIPEPFGPTLLTHQLGVFWFKVTVSGVPRHVLEAGAGTNAIEKCIPLFQALRDLEEKMNRPGALHDGYRSVPHPINLNIGIFESGDWPSTVPARATFHCRLSYFPGTPYADARKLVVETIQQAAAADPWLSENPPRVDFYGFRSDGHTLAMDQPVMAALNGCHRDLTAGDAAPYIATCTTDLRAFHSFGRGQATCYGPVAENIHAANERVNIDSVVHTARAYALFLSRWCGLTE